MFKISVGNINKSISVKYCPFCGAEANKLEDHSFSGESQDNAKKVNFQCHGCGLYFSVGEINSENYKYLYDINQGPLSKRAVEQDFLNNFRNGVWIENNCSEDLAGKRVGGLRKKV